MTVTITARSKYGGRQTFVVPAESVERFVANLVSQGYSIESID